MSSYFDTWARDVREAGNIEDNAAYLARVTEIEASRVAEVNLVTGDREFPCVMRENIQGLIAQWSLGGPLEPTSAAREFVLTVRCSRLEQELHTAFHTLAYARIETRFGVLNDNPTHILAMRDEYDKERQPNFGPSKEGSIWCRNGAKSIAAGGTVAYCTCAACF